jgi:hypothetical protein
MHVKQNLKILFYLKRKKMTRDGKAPICIYETTTLAILLADCIRNSISFNFFQSKVTIFILRLLIG